MRDPPTEWLIDGATCMGAAQARVRTSPENSRPRSIRRPRKPIPILPNAKAGLYLAFNLL